MQNKDQVCASIRLAVYILFVHRNEQELEALRTELERVESEKLQLQDSIEQQAAANEAQLEREQQRASGLEVQLEECQAAHSEEMKHQDAAHEAERQRDSERMADLLSQLEQLQSANAALNSVLCALRLISFCVCTVVF